MALTTRDVITQDFVRDTVEEVVESELVYRRAFREIDATGVESNSYTFNIDNDDMSKPTIVGENEEAPRHQGTDRQLTVNFEKFMGEVSLTMEAMADGLIEMKAREIEDLARKMAERLNEEAYNVLTESIDSVGDSNDVLSFSDITEGMKTLRKRDYRPDLLFVDVEGYVDLLNDDNFNRATDTGDEVVRSGEVGQIADMTVVVDSTQEIGTTEDGGTTEDSGSSAGAIAVDSTKFGYELTRTPMSTTEYEEPERQADVVQAFTRKAWTAIFEDAAVRIDG